MPGIFLGICVQDRMTIPKIDAWASASVSYPLCFELAISGTKGDGFEEIVISHIFQTSSVWWVPLPPECQHWCPHIPFPLHWTFYPWSSRDAPENIFSNVQSFLLTHPRGVSPVWHWASSRQFALCGASSFSLTFQVGSSRMVVAHLVHSACTSEHKGTPIMGGNEKKLIPVEDSWASSLLVFHKVGRDTFSNSAFHFVWFLLPLVFHLSPPFVGISFSQDQVTWFQWNGISFTIIVSPLPFSLRSGLHLHFLEGFVQLLT